MRVVQNGLGLLRYCFILLALTLSIPSSAASSDRSAWIHVQDVRVPVADGVNVHGRIYYPETQKAAPTIVLLNPWSMGGWVYGLKAMQWARKGFVVFTYNLRGWVGSEGEADVGGPLDMADVSHVLDWLEMNPRVDSKAIGMGGVSLGAGVSLLAAAHDPRIRAVVALSGWSDLYSPIYGYSTQRANWNLVLRLGSILGTGSDAASHTKEIREAITSGDLSLIHDYAGGRSPRLLLERYTKHQPAVFISHNYSDILFPVSDMWNFFNELNVPKKIMLQPGVHGSTEIFSMLTGRQNQVWDAATDWLEHWLREPQSPLPDRVSEYNIQLDERTIKGQSMDDLIKARPRYYLNRSHTIRFGWNSGISSGVPLVYPLLAQCEILPSPIASSRIDPRQAAVYELAEIANDVDLIGIPRLSLLMDIKRGTSVQVIAHLFRVNKKDQWQLISLTPYTLHDVRPGQTRNVEFELYGGFAHLNRGDRLVLALDTFDPEFSTPRSPYFVIRIEAGDESWIELPLASDPALNVASDWSL